MLKLPPEEQKLLEAQTTTEVVSLALQSFSRSKKFWKSAKPLPDTAFLTAVVSARTHEQFIKDVVLPEKDKVPETVGYMVSSLLRHADAFDQFLGSMGNTSFASPFIFGAIRFMLTVAVKNIKLFLATRKQFEEINLRLSRLDIYLKAVKEPTESMRLMCIRALVNILRFCGLATKYFTSTSRPS